MERNTYNSLDFIAFFLENIDHSFEVLPWGLRQLLFDCHIQGRSQCESSQLWARDSPHSSQDLEETATFWKTKVTISFFVLCKRVSLFESGFFWFFRDRPKSWSWDLGAILSTSKMNNTNRMAFFGGRREKSLIRVEKRHGDIVLCLTSWGCCEGG